MKLNWSLVNQIRAEMGSHAVPPKRRTKVGYKANGNSFNRNLRGVPGGGIMKMADAAETGTVLANSSTLARLENSPRNCNTTKGNYIV